MNPSAIAYITLAVLVQTSVLLAPIFLKNLESASHTALLFLASFFTAVPAVFWPGLRPRHLFMILPLLAACEILFVWLLSANIGVTEVVKSLIIQLFISGVVASGLWMRLKNDRYHTRRAARDREEQETLFQLKQRLRPSDDISFYKYQTIMSDGLCLAGILKGEIIGCLHTLRFGDFFLIYDFMIEPGPDRDNMQYELLRSLFTRLDARDSTVQIIALLENKDAIENEMYRSAGFTPLADDSAMVIDLRKCLDGLYAEKFPEWKPFARVVSFMRLED